ncbi:MAG: phospholipase D family protein [bacterium]|nr:phospholipase D family protein [bacterium]
MVRQAYLLMAVLLVSAGPAWAGGNAGPLPAFDGIESALRYTPNRVQPLISGQDALAARLALVEHARQRIDLQYYLYHDDKVGRFLGEALLRAADRGVQIRVLIDDMHGVDNRIMQALDQHPNIQVRRYNPFRMRSLHLLEAVLAFDRVDRRMHNKQLTVDGESSIVGGRNIGEEYFGVSDDVTFADLDVLVDGPAVPDLEQVFEAYWNNRHSKPLDRHAEEGGGKKLQELRLRLSGAMARDGEALKNLVANSDFSRAGAAGGALQQECPAAVLADSPDKKNSAQSSAVARRMAQQLRRSQKDVLILSAYFVPGDKGSEAFTAALDHGVGVEIVTNSLASTDVPAVHAGYQRYRELLLQAGARLWEMKPVLKKKSRWHFAFGGSSNASLHSKAYLFDQRYLFVGSFNMDPRSAALNTEMGLLFDCPALAAPLMQGLRELLPELAYRVYLDPDGSLRWEEKDDDTVSVFDREPHAGFWRRTAVWWLRWLPIESEL